MLNVPTGAIQLKHFTDRGLLAQIDAAVPHDKNLRLQKVVNANKGGENK